MKKFSGTLAEVWTSYFNNRLDAHLSLVLLIAFVYGPIYFLASGLSIPLLFTFFSSVLVFLASYYHKKMALDRKMKFWSMVFLSGALWLTQPAFFFATGPVVSYNNLQTHDATLLQIDNAIFGDIFPSGQVALWLDQSLSYGPNSTFGKWYTEILQVAYTSYFMWGILLLLALLLKYYRAYSSEDEVEERKVVIALKLYLCGWLIGYYFTFFANLSFPGKSPRLFLQDQYDNELDGFGLAGLLRSLSTNNSTFGSFPSGHVAESWIVAFYAVRNFPLLGYTNVIAAVLITIATVVLRYHYFVDLLGAVVIIVAGLFFGLYFPRSYQKSLEQQAEENYACLVEMESSAAEKV